VRPRQSGDPAHARISGRAVPGGGQSKTQADSAKISRPSPAWCEEDPTLSWHMEPATNQTIVQGMGDQHIDVVIRRAET
jgi:translation elongation factor EF-G